MSVLFYVDIEEYKYTGPMKTQVLPHHGNGLRHYTLPDGHTDCFTRNRNTCGSTGI